MIDYANIIQNIMTEYQKGRCDRRAGLFFEDNPYEPDSKEWNQWIEGYEDEEVEEILNDDYCQRV